MEILHPRSSIKHTITFCEVINPYNTNLAAELDEFSPEELMELKRKAKKDTPKLVNKKAKPTRGLLNIKIVRTQS